MFQLQNEWVICRVFQKSSGGKKIHIPGMVKLISSSSSMLPPLMDPSPYESEAKAAGESSHVTCFSDQRTQDDNVDSLETPSILAASSATSSKASDISPASWNSFPNLETGNSQFPGDFLMQDQSTLRLLVESNESNINQNLGSDFSQESGFHSDTNISSVIYNNEMVQKSIGNYGFSSASAGPVDFGCLWNY